jgi:hypothetical protein
VDEVVDEEHVQVRLVAGAHHRARVVRRKQRCRKRRHWLHCCRRLTARAVQRVQRRRRAPARSRSRLRARRCDGGI